MTVRRRWVWLLWAMVAAVAPRGASADGDGGTQSPFAVGAGNRALAMGGAFAAISDDASGSMWNPGGLGRATRIEFQAGQTTFLDLESSESYAAVVWPDWRWGALSSTFRHFGVGGIDRRDSRNVVIEENLSHTESELGIGYGRSLGDAWSVGGVVKARHQSVVGLSGSGFGVDVGVSGRPGALLGARAPWAEDLTWGLSVANLVRPAIRLDLDNVADPSALRTGLAYRRSFWATRTVLAAIDLTHAQDAGTRIHAGMELKLHPQLSLRWGLDRGSFTAGTGIQWRDLALDYVFEENAVDAVHRVGMTFGFGPTVTESREAALRAEEEALQTRLADAFQRRQSEQIAQLVTSAEEHRAQGRFDEALELLAAVATLQPGHLQATTLEARCLAQKARQLENGGAYADAAVLFRRVLALAPGDSAAATGLKRCQTQGDLRAARSARLRVGFAQAVDAFGADNLAAARKGFAEILATEPGDEDARRMLRRTEDAIARRTQNLIKQANRCTEGKLWSEASALIEQAGALDPQAFGLSAARDKLARARQLVESGRTANAGTASVKPASNAGTQERSALQLKPQEIEAFYKRGLDAMNQRRPDDALRYWELVWAAAPNHQRVAEYLKREYLTRGMELFASGRLDEAVGWWERALRVDPADQRAIGYLARAQQQLARTREILGNGR